MRIPKQYPTPINEVIALAQVAEAVRDLTNEIEVLREQQAQLTSHLIDAIKKLRPQQ